MAEQRWPTYDELFNALREADAKNDRQAIAYFQRELQQGNYAEAKQPQEESTLARDQTPLTELAGATLQGIGSGASFGTTDEIGAGVRAALGNFADRTLGAGMYATGLGVDFAEDDDRSWLDRFKFYRDEVAGEDDRSFGERYNEALESNRASMDRAREEHPWATGIGEVVGGFAVPGAGVAGAAKGAQSLTRAVGRAGLAGAGTGALAGYGYSEFDPLATLAQEGGQVNDKVVNEFINTASDMLKYASVGGTAGVLIPGTAGIIAKGAQKLAKMTAPGKKFLLNEGARKEIAEAIEEDLKSGLYGDVSTPDGFRRAQEALRKELRDIKGMTIADVGPATRAVAERIAKYNVPGARRILTDLIERNQGQWPRYKSHLIDTVGVGDDSFARTVKLLREKTRTEAKKAYDAVGDDLVKITPEMEAIIHNKAAKGALKDINQHRDLDGLPHFGRRIGLAKKAGDIETVTDPTSGMPIVRRVTEDVPETVLLPKAGDVVSVKDMDTIIRGWDDLVSTRYRKGKSIAPRLRDMRDDLREAVYKQSEGYRDARAVFRSSRQDEEALELGRKLFDRDADFMAADLAEMSDSEKLAFRIGALRAITSKLRNKPYDADIRKGVLNSPGKEEAVRLAFADEESFLKFMDFVDLETRMFETMKQVTGNSATARRTLQEMAIADPMEQIAALAGYAGGLSFGGSIPPSISGYLTKSGYRSIVGNRRAEKLRQAVRDVSNYQADTLLGNDLASVMQQQQLPGLLGTDMPIFPLRAVGGATTGILGMQE